MAGTVGQTYQPFIGTVNAIMLHRVVEEQKETLITINDVKQLRNMIVHSANSLSWGFSIAVDYRPITFAVPEWAPDWLEFNDLRATWKKDRKRYQSFAADFTRDPSYLRIIGMGEKAIPFILWEMVRELSTGEPDHWFAALWATSRGANPVPEASRGRIREMAMAWLQWGVREKRIDAEVLEGLVPESRHLG